MEMNLWLNKIANHFSDILQDNLVGVYLHGSLAMGGFNPHKSDIDLLIVVKHSMTRNEQRSLANQLLQHHHQLPSGRGIELSVVLESAVKHFVYPTPFEFHYSDFHRTRYESDEHYICGGSVDPDLAAHFTVTYHRGLTLLGEPLENVFQPIEKTAYIQSIVGDIQEASTAISENPVYYTLNLCRVLLYLREGRVASKQEGGEWGIETFPRFRPLISLCLDAYIGAESADVLRDHPDLKPFADYMLKEIGQAQE